MKKITFFIALLTISLGFSQELVTNGDFEAGSAPWGGNSDGGTNINVIDDGTGNFVNAAIIVNAADTWRVNLQQVLDLTQGQGYELSYDAYVDAGTATMIAGISENFGGFGGAPTFNPALTTTSQTFTHTMTFNNASTTNGRVFFDMGGTANSGKTIYIDNVSLTEIVDLCNDGILNNGETEIDCGGPNCDACPSPPSTAAPLAPIRNPSDVISVFSDEYTDAVPSGVETFGPTTFENFTVENPDDTRRLSVGANGQGMQYLYLGGTPLDLSGFDKMHFDFYIEGDVAASQEIQVFLIDFNQYPSGAGNTSLFTNFDANAIGSGVWYSADIDLDSFNGTPLTRNNIALVQVILQGGAGAPTLGPIYFDNLYFYNVNDSCAEATPIPLDGSTIEISNVGATDSGQTTSCDPMGVISDVWYSVVADSDEFYLETTAPNVAIFSGACGSLTEVACNPGTNVAVTGITSGNTYYVRVTDDGTGRAPGPFTLKISGASLSNTDFNANQFKIYPNPTIDVWNIEASSSVIDTIEIFDILGKKVQTLSPNNLQATIHASSLKTGLYLAKFYSGDAVKTIRLVKN
ncbi:MAG: T9SS type A sorting domain-containing protein [Winogradskyella sp.]|uniref:T9SS type A sorting domain-containing protein n=1 Tax=Winogradskyella sp. TaxID=1883156 RepID=UPI0017B47120|nr:T9SS type A sorting domain-containing protein [Winogradskyella sp.]MBT8245054.1 T9SS type A sorting domain-containing protein [Winogradskyella sp.]NNK22104.1 T9SS type A sorting domain-containing protein [Winogradskyella sp.]